MTILYLNLRLQSVVLCPSDGLSSCRQVLPGPRPRRTRLRPWPIMDSPRKRRLRYQNSDAIVKRHYNSQKFLFSNVFLNSLTNFCPCSFTSVFNNPTPISRSYSLHTLTMTSSISVSPGLNRNRCSHISKLFIHSVRCTACPMRLYAFAHPRNIGRYPDASGQAYPIYPGDPY